MPYAFAGACLVALAPYLKIARAFAEDTLQKLTLSNAEWKKRLTVEQYGISRQENTKRALTSVLLDEHREGFFVCAGCDMLLLPLKFKFDSVTRQAELLRRDPQPLRNEKRL